MILRSDYEDQNLWSLVRKFEDEFLTRLRGDMNTNSMILDTTLEDEQSCTSDENTINQYDERMSDIRSGFRGVRIQNDIPVGWPVGLRELHCDLCDRWHTNFLFQNLHPLLRFLEDITLCIRGHGSQVMIKLAIVSSNLAPRTCFEHSRSEAVNFAHHLRRLCLAVGAGGEGVATDSVAQPRITKFVTEYGLVGQNEYGLTLAEVTPLLLRIFRNHLVEWRWELFSIMMNRDKVSRLRSARIDTAATYPTTKDWDDHMRAFPLIALDWVMTVAMVDLIMADVTTWESITTQDVGEIRECWISL